MILWQVFNRHGRCYMAEGDNAEEAIENARPLFASNWVYAPWRESVPDPSYAFERMCVFPIGDAAAEALHRYEAASAWRPLRLG